MTRVSATTIDQFRRVLQTDYASEGELILSIKGQCETTWQMAAGSAWEAAIMDDLVATGRYPMTDVERDARFVSLMHDLKNTYDGSEVDLESRDELAFLNLEPVRSGRYSFSPCAIALARQVVGPGVWQVKRVANFNGVDVVAKADLINGLHIHDVKAKFSSANAGDYEHDLQWRFYLAVHEAKFMTFDIFEFREPKEDGFCYLRDVVQVPFWTYPDIMDDCKRWVALFMQWAESKGLTQYFDREGTM